MQFEAVYRSHYASVWRAVRRFGVPEKDALDAVQEVFVAAYRRWPEFEARGQVKSWLWGIAYRVAADRRRSATARREVFREEANACSKPVSDLQAELEQRDLMRLLEAVLDTLPLEQRAVFTMFEMEGLTGAEIAEALAIPAGTVRSRLRLAREAFCRGAKQVEAELGPVRSSGGER